jgi:hypothetical protein
MPGDIQDRISHAIDMAIDTRIMPATTLLDNKIEALSSAQAASADRINQTIQDVQISTAARMHANEMEDRKDTTRLENRLDLVISSQRASAYATTDINTKLEDLSVAHSASTDLVIQNTRQTGQATAKAIHIQGVEGRAQSSSLHKKLEQVDASIGAIRNSLQDLSSAQLNVDTNMSKPEVERALQNTLSSIWLLLSSLHVSIRELVYVSYSKSQCKLTCIRMLLTPYLIAFYQNTVHRLLQYGDHFLFEDAIGRVKRLPCAQFQHWGCMCFFVDAELR